MNAPTRPAGHHYDKYRTAYPIARRLMRGFLDAFDGLAGAVPVSNASVPREPMWRVLEMARGKYPGALGNTPGHVNHWGRASFLELIARRFDVLQTRSPLPWTMVLCRRR